MTVRITREVEAKEIRNNIGFCYLCGNSIHETRQDAPTTREHVIPRSFLGKLNDSTAWPIILDVHKKCELDLKQTRDTWLRLLESLQTDPKSKLNDLEKKWKILSATSSYKNSMGEPQVAESYVNWVQLPGDREKSGIAWKKHLRALPFDESIELNKLRNDCIRLIEEIIFTPSERIMKGHYRSAPMTFDQISPPGYKDEIKAIGGFEKIMMGVWTWIRGLHTFLYHEYLEPKVPYLSLPSMPIFGTRFDTSIEAFADKSSLIRYSIEAAEFSDKWDGISAWGNTFVFKCAWVQDTRVPDYSRCVWKLIYQEAAQDTRWSTYPGAAWHGMYDCESPPRIASIILDKDFGKYSEHLQSLD